MLKKITCHAFIMLSLVGLMLNNFASSSAQTESNRPVSSLLPSDTETPKPATPTPESPILASTGAFFALSVANISASTRWYSEKLGLKVVMQPPKMNQSTVVVLEGGGLIVELLQHDDAQALSKAAPAVKQNFLGHGLFKAGVIVDDFDKVVATLKERNVPIAFGPFPARADQRANVIIRDLEGNLIQFFGK